MSGMLPVAVLRASTLCISRSSACLKVTFERVPRTSSASRGESTVALCACDNEESDDFLDVEGEEEVVVVVVVAGVVETTGEVIALSTSLSPLGIF